jgi:translocator protein
MKKFDLKLLIISLVVVYLVAFIGSIFTSGSTSGEWYDSIKPSLTPPGWVFPIVWNILFFMIGLSLYFALQSSDNKQKKYVFIVFGINFFLNIFWSFLYFYLKNPFFAFIEIIVLLVSILSMIIVTWKIDKKSSYILVPYFLWVCFASLLNYLSIK